MLKAHVAAYQKYFDRVKLDLGITDAAKLPTDERLKNFDSVNDPQFVTFIFSIWQVFIDLFITTGRPASDIARHLE